jgi:hypothetical protein
VWIEAGRDFDRRAVRRVYAEIEQRRACWDGGVGWVGMEGSEHAQDEAVVALMDVDVTVARDSWFESRRLDVCSVRCHALLPLSDSHHRRF